MKRTAAMVVVGLLVAGGLARADLIPPGTKNIPIDHKIETDKEYPDWVFFTVGGNGNVKAVKLDPKNPLTIPGSSAIGNGPIPQPGEKRTRPYRSTSLVAVPKDALKQYANEKELHAALDAGKVPGAVESKPLSDHENVKMTDARKSVVLRYKLEKIDPKDGLVLAPLKDEPKPGEEEEAAAPRSVSQWLAIGLAASAVIGFTGLWFVRRRGVRPVG